MILASHLEPWVICYSNPRSFLFSPFVERQRKPVLISTGGGTSSKWVEEGQGRPRSSRAIRCHGLTRGTAWSDRWRSAMELSFLSMADRGREQEYGSLERHREPEGVEGRWRRVNEEVGSASGCPNARWSTSTCAAMVVGALCMVATSMTRVAL